MGEKFNNAKEAVAIGDVRDESRKGFEKEQKGGDMKTKKKGKKS